jgi:hypothetical protein
MASPTQTLKLFFAINTTHTQMANSHPRATAAAAIASKTSPAHFVQNTVKVQMHLAPCFAGNITKGVHEKLNRFLLRYRPCLHRVYGRYVDEVKGVVVSYSNVRLLAAKGKINYDCPFVHFHVAASVTSFSPVAGTRLGLF